MRIRIETLEKQNYRGINTFLSISYLLYINNEQAEKPVTVLISNNSFTYPLKTNTHKKLLGIQLTKEVKYVYNENDTKER